VVNGPSPVRSVGCDVGSDHLPRIDDSIEFLRADGADLQRGLLECQVALQGDLRPAGDELGLQLVLTGDLGLALQAGEDFNTNESTPRSSRLTCSEDSWSFEPT
jgi:hypothetical protein